MTIRCFSFFTQTFTSTAKRFQVLNSARWTERKRQFRGNQWPLHVESLESRCLLAAVPTITIDDVQQVEGNSGTSDFVFTVTRSGKTNQPSTIDYTTIPVSGSATPGDDYVPSSGTLNFAPGEKSKLVTVMVNGDGSIEPDETFIVDLDIVANGKFGKEQGVGTIENDDTGTSPLAFLATATLEDFEDGNLSEYIPVKSDNSNASVTTAAQHDGNFGLQDEHNDGPGGWIYRDDAQVQLSQGDTFAIWIRSSDVPTKVAGPAYFGFGATSTGTLSVRMHLGAGDLQIQRNAKYRYEELATVSQSWLSDHWYQIVVDWRAAASPTDENIQVWLYDSDGATLLNFLSAHDDTITSGGIAFRAWGDPKHFDTVELGVLSLPISTAAATASVHDHRSHEKSYEVDPEKRSSSDLFTHNPLAAEMAFEHLRPSRRSSTWTVFADDGATNRIGAKADDDLAIALTVDDSALADEFVTSVDALYGG